VCFQAGADDATRNTGARMKTPAFWAGVFLFGNLLAPPARGGGHQAVYVPAVVDPPVPVQFVWKNLPRGWSVRS